MGRSVDDLIYQSRAILTAAQEAYQAGRTDGEQLIPLPWRENLLLLKEPLRIGYYTEDGAIKTSPACIRGVTETVEALKKAGHILVPFTPPDGTWCLSI
jgi:Asp-tRNA(Asn)/Glu-tRNA(Gln) amidotransferase A subunit family amidase